MIHLKKNVFIFSNVWVKRLKKLWYPSTESRNTCISKRDGNDGRNLESSKKHSGTKLEFIIMNYKKKLEWGKIRNKKQPSNEEFHFGSLTTSTAAKNTRVTRLTRIELK